MESESRTLNKLQQQVDALTKSNEQKEKAIKNLEKDAEKRNKQEKESTVGEQEQTSVTLEEAVGEV
mgnify:CR=1 FL=1